MRIRNSLPLKWAFLQAFIGYDTQDKRDKCRRLIRCVMAESMKPTFMGHWTGVHRLTAEAKQKILDTEPF